MSIARNLKRAMDENAVSVTALAALSGIEKTFLTKYLSGKVKPSESVLTRLAECIGVPVTALAKDPVTRTKGKIRPEDAARRLHRSPQDIRIGIRMGLLPFGTAYKRPGATIYTYEINPEQLERYAQQQEQFYSNIT